jgi:hypothetical protein
MSHIEFEKALHDFKTDLPTLQHIAPHDPTIPGITPTARLSSAGTVYKAAEIMPLSAAPTMEDFNALLAALKSAGIMDVAER